MYDYAYLATAGILHPEIFSQDYTVFAMYDINGANIYWYTNYCIKNNIKIQLTIYSHKLPTVVVVEQHRSSQLETASGGPKKFVSIFKKYIK
jgi:hypothetical protein